MLISGDTSRGDVLYAFEAANDVFDGNLVLRSLERNRVGDWLLSARVADVHGPGHMLNHEPLPLLVPLQIPSICWHVKHTIFIFLPEMAAAKYRRHWYNRGAGEWGVEFTRRGDRWVNPLLLCECSRARQALYMEFVRMARLRVKKKIPTLVYE